MPGHSLSTNRDSAAFEACSSVSVPLVARTRVMTAPEAGKRQLNPYYSGFLKDFDSLNPTVSALSRLPHQSDSTATEKYDDTLDFQEILPSSVITDDPGVGRGPQPGSLVFVETSSQVDSQSAMEKTKIVSSPSLVGSAELLRAETLRLRPIYRKGLPGKKSNKAEVRVTCLMSYPSHWSHFISPK